MNQFPCKSKSNEFIRKSYLSLFSNLDESRVLLYYASPETAVSPKEQNDLYGRLIEKKRVGVPKSLTFLFFSNALCCFYAQISLLFVLAAFCTPFLIYLLDHLNYNVNHLYVIHVVMHVFIMFHHFIRQIYHQQKNKNHQL